MGTLTKFYIYCYNHKSETSLVELHQMNTCPNASKLGFAIL